MSYKDDDARNVSPRHHCFEEVGCNSLPCSFVWPIAIHLTKPCRRCLPCTRFLHGEATGASERREKGPQSRREAERGFWGSGSLSLHLDVPTMEHTKVNGVT